MTEKQIESLLGQLSDKLKALQGTYSDFAEKCEKPDADFDQTNEKPDFFHVFAEVKAEMNVSLKVLVENKKYLLLKLEKFKGFGQTPVVKVLDEFRPVVKGLEAAEKAINLLFEDLVKLEKSVKIKIQQDSESIQRLKNQCQANRRTQSLDNWDQSPVLTSRTIDLRSQHHEETECRLILEKMSSVTDRVHYKTDLFEFRQNKDLVKSQGSDNNKLVRNLESEINRLRSNIRALEENEIRSFEYRTKYESCQFELSELLNKIEFLERTLTEKEFKSRQLFKTIEESHKERKKNFESFNKCREEFEFKLDEQDLLIKELTEEKNEQYLLIRTINHQLETLEKEKNDLAFENERVKNNLEACVKKLDMKFNQKLDQVENSEINSNQNLLNVNPLKIH
jgi:hypothetical protein